MYSGCRVCRLTKAIVKDISKNTGGRYFRATDRDDLENIYAEIDRLEKTEIEVNVFKRYEDEFRNFLLIGLILLLLELLLRKTILKYIRLVFRFEDISFLFWLVIIPGLCLLMYAVFLWRKRRIAKVGDPALVGKIDARFQCKKDMDEKIF